jgi:hypothetical protein
MTPLRIATILPGLDGAETALLAARAMDAALFRHTVIMGEDMDVGELEAIHVPALRSPLPQRALARVLAEGEYDVAHSYGSGVAARSAVVRAGTPRIVHTWNGPYWQRYRSRRAVLAERSLSPRVDAYFAVGTGTAALALRLGLAPAAKVRVIWPAVDSSRVPSGLVARAEARRRLNLPLGTLVVAAAGCAAAGGDARLFARMVAELPADVHGVWFGPGGPRAVAAGPRSGAAGRLHWLGADDDVTRLLPAFDQPGRCGAIPALLVEAVTAGVPLVAAAVPCLEDVVRPGETGLLVTPGDHRRMAEAVLNLLDHPAEARRMVAAARDWVGDRCSPARLAAVMAATYRT